MKPIVRELVAGAAASAFLVVLLGATPVGFGIALALSGAVYLGTRLLLPARASVPPVPRESGSEGQVRQLRAAAARFAELSSKVERGVGEDLRRVARALENIADQLRRDPERLFQAGELMALHLPSAKNLVERHVDLADRPHLDGNAQQELEESRRTIGRVAEAFENHYGRLLEQDVQELRVDRMVFEELLRLDDRGGSASPGDGKAEVEKREHL